METLEWCRLFGTWNEETGFRPTFHEKWRLVRKSCLSVDGYVISPRFYFSIHFKYVKNLEKYFPESKEIETFQLSLYQST